MTFHALRLTWQAAWFEARSNRRSFWLQVAIMVVNDVVWVIFWALLFNRVGDLRGWGFDQIVLLFAVLTTAGGIVLGLLNNTRRIGELASTGGLDAVLALPTPPLLALMARRVETVNVGDLGFGLVLFLVGGSPSPMRFAIFVFGVICASLIISGFLILMGSTSFFVSRNEASELGFHAILLFANYPVDIFTGYTRFFLYGVVPAGFVSTVPAKLIGEFSVGWAVALATVAVAVTAAGWTAFTLGLRRYTSGATWTAA